MRRYHYGEKAVKKIYAILLCIIIGYAAIELACQDNTAQERQNAEEPARQDDTTQEQPDVEELYNLLNKNLFGMRYEDDEAIMQEIYHHAEDVQGDFEPVVNVDSIFPEELVVLLEDAFYHSGSMQLRKEENVYYDTICGLGAEDFRLDLEEIYELFPQVASIREQVQDEGVYTLLAELYGIPYNCYKIFHINLSENQDNYVFLYGWGGTAGYLSVKLTERVGDSFLELSEFAVQNDGYGSVIRYEGVFYYVFLQKNFNLKDYDGVRIYRLGSDAEKENLLIRYLPKYYESHAVDTQNGNMESELETYIDSVLRNLEDIDAGYLDSGYHNRDVGVDRIRGDEQRLELRLGYKDYCYKMDIANMGVPVYMESYLFTGGTPESIKTHFYLYDEEGGSWKEIPQLQIDDPYTSLLQMWFKKFGDVVYTFRVYHVFDYNYIFNVSVLEGDILTEKGTYIISPRREFELTEGGIEYFGL